tara:strand:+ start:134 stop:283 length:150 start_codon:yes stop_codon:yes gene_type:complete
METGYDEGQNYQFRCCSPTSKESEEEVIAEIICSIFLLIWAYAVFKVSW